MGARERPLTRTQASVLRFVCERIARDGCAPTYAEIGAHFGWSSLATVAEHLENLEMKGYIRRGINEPRGITVLVPFDEIGALPVERKS